MRGSLLVSFFDYDLGIADYVQIYINGVLLRRIYSQSDNLYSLPLYNGDVVRVDYYSPSGDTTSHLNLIKREYTSENVDGNLGIVDVQIVYDITYTSYTFTVNVSSKAYDFDYFLSNNIVTQFQLWTEKSEPILTEGSDFINIDRPPPIIYDGLSLYLDANKPSSYNGSGSIWYDLSGYNNNATMTGSSNPTFVQTSKINYFNVNPTGQSQNQFFIVNDSLSLDVSTGITMEMWIYYDNIVNTTASVLNKQDPSTWSSPYGAYDFRFVGADSEMWIAGYSSGPVYRFVGGTPQNSWNQYVVTWDNINLVYKIYINGTLVGTSSTTTATSIQNTPYPLWIGADASGIGENFTGKMSIIRLYSRALSSSEVLQNYNSDQAKI